MMAHSEATRRHGPRELPRQSHPADRRRQRHHPQHHPGSVYALNENPDQYKKLRENPALIETIVPEMIRWQTPLAHMRRTALEDTEIGGKTIKKGEKVVMWYVSGNRDEEVVENADDFVIDRRAAAHASVIRLRHPPLRRHAARGIAAAYRVGRDPEALRTHRGGR